MVKINYTWRGRPKQLEITKRDCKVGALVAAATLAVSGLYHMVHSDVTGVKPGRPTSRGNRTLTVQRSFALDPEIVEISPNSGVYTTWDQYYDLYVSKK